LPAARIVNVAGTRAFVAGTRAFVGGGFAFVADDVLATDVVDDVVEAPMLPLVPDPAVVVEVTEVEDVFAVAAAVVEVCGEPPHDARSSANPVTTKRRAGWLTFSA